MNGDPAVVPVGSRNSACELEIRASTLNRSIVVNEEQSPGRDNLHLYLNDHLAGSITALEMIDNAVEQHPDDRFGEFFRELRIEIQADQEKLRGLIQKVGGEESTIRKAGAWLAEKLSRAKLGDARDSIALLQVLEGLVLGITGKNLLWRSLAGVEKNFPALQGMDLDELQQRATDQLQRVETLRLEIAREAFRA